MALERPKLAAALADIGDFETRRVAIRERGVGAVGEDGRPEGHVRGDVREWEAASGW